MKNKLHIKIIDDNSPVSIALLSDIHAFKQENVIQYLKQHPTDIIVICGDLLERCDKGHDPRGKRHVPFEYIRHILALGLRFLLSNRYHQDNQNAYNLLKELSKIAPIYLSRGNHEWYYTNEDLAVFKKYHIHLLDNDYLNTKDYSIAGLSSHYDLQMLEAFEKQKQYKILLSHHPEYYQMIKDYQIDLILSGHGHGGQIRIGNKGLYAPGQGFFSKYTLGKYGHMIVSSGLSNTLKIPRINNPKTLIIIKNAKGKRSHEV